MIAVRFVDRQCGKVRSSLGHKHAPCDLGEGAGGELALAISLLSWYYHQWQSQQKKW
jgi:hypothetical protein